MLHDILQHDFITKVTAQMYNKIFTNGNRACLYL